MWYVVLARDVPGTLAQRVATRPAHRERLVALQDAGRLLLAGPLPGIDAEDPGPAGFVGSLVIVDFPSQADAQAWAQADPYFTAGVYASVDVLPFLRTFG